MPLKRNYARRNKKHFKANWKLHLGYSNKQGHKVGLGFDSKSAAFIKKVVNKTAEHKTWTGTMISNANLQHETFYYLNLLSGITLGTGENSRNGDQVHVNGINIKLSSESLAANAATSSYRVLIIKNTQQFVNYASYSSSAGVFDQANVFEQTQANCSDSLIAMYDNTKGQVLYDNIVQTNPTIATNQINKVIDISIPGFKYKYTNTGSANYGTYYNYYLVIIPHVVGGTLATTNVMNLHTNYLISFTDF